MRTTLNLDDDIYQAVATLSQSSGESMGKVLSELVRCSIRPKSTKRSKTGFVTFDVPPDAPIVPGNLVQKIWEEESLD
jgi:negative regulator of replication initiation